MEKIELTELQIKIIGQYRRGEINQFTISDEKRIAFSKVIDDATALCEKLNAYDETNGDLILWYYALYKKQKNEN